MREMIRCPTCGNDLVYSPIPALYFCLEEMHGDSINIRTGCKPWIAKDAPAEDLMALTDRIVKLAPQLEVPRPKTRDRTAFVAENRHFRAKVDSPV